MGHIYRKPLPSEFRIVQRQKHRSHFWPTSVVALVLILAGTSAAIGESRVGPTDPINGYPMFYEDANGLRLDLCTDLNKCFFEPPDPGLPASFPDNWPDEAFYWAAESIMQEADGTKAILVMAREAAFFNDAAVDGDQIVFSRTRFYIDGAPQMVGNTYTITYPYGTVDFVSAPGDAGPGVKGEGFSDTRDVGISNPMEFTASLNEFPVFLTPALPDGTAGRRGSLPPGTLLVDDSPLGTGTRLTGSPYGTNFFRIEGPEIGTVFPSYQCADPTLGGVQDALGDVLTDCVELDLFAIMGRVASRHGVDIDRADYEKVDPGTGPTSYVNVFAHSVEGQQLVAIIDDGVQVPMTEGFGGHYFSRLQEGTHYVSASQRKPLIAKVNNITDLPFSVKNRNISDQVIIIESQLDTSTGLLHITAQSSNKVDPALLSTDGSASSQPIPGTLKDNGLGSVSAIIAIGSPNAIGVPPERVAIQSQEGGYAIRDIEIIGSTTNGGVLELLSANAGTDQTVVAGNTVILSGADSAGQIVSYYWDSSVPLIQPTCDNTSCSQTSVSTPEDNLGWDKLVIDFTLTVYDQAGASSQDTVQLTVTNPVVQVADSCTIVSAQYRSDRDQWRIEGTSDVTDNQLISVYLGLVNDTSNPIGTTRVDALGVWDLRTGRGDEIAIPTSADTEVWVSSDLGCIEGSTFLLR